MESCIDQGNTRPSIPISHFDFCKRRSIAREEGVAIRNALHSCVSIDYDARAVGPADGYAQKYALMLPRGKCQQLPDYAVHIDKTSDSNQTLMGLCHIQHSPHWVSLQRIKIG